MSFTIQGDRKVSFWYDGHMSKITSINPSTYQVIGSVDSSTDQEVQAAVEKARQAQPAWENAGLEERSKAIQSFMKISQERAEDIAEIMSQEMGKPILSSRGQVKETVEYWHAYLDMAKEALAPEIIFETDEERHTQYREPLGVLAAISPWNFPFLALAWQMGQALIAGNTIVYKPSEETVLFAKLVAELVAASDLPEGVLNILIGNGQVGEQLVSQTIDGILFTGSTATGQRITELVAKSSVRVFTEMGGSAPGIVFEDADVPTIIDTIYDMRFENTGQYCDGLKRLLVHESKLDEVLAALAEANLKRVVGNASDEDTDIGPLVAERQLKLLEGQVADALDKGAKVQFGGKQPDGLEGAYYLPTVLTEVSYDMRVWHEEVFGPVLAVVTFTSEDEAVKLANDTPYGLGAFVFTNSKERYQRIAKQLKVGNVAHNNTLYYRPQIPFGGYKQSGNSRTNGVEGFAEITQIKVVSEEK